MALDTRIPMAVPNVLAMGQHVAQTNALNANTLGQGFNAVQRGMEAPMRRNALALDNRNSQLAQTQAEQQMLGQVLDGVAQNPATWGRARQFLVQNGVFQEGELPEQLTPQAFEELSVIAFTPPEQLTDWTRKMQYLTPEEQRQAARIDVGLDARAAGVDLTALQQRALDAGLVPGTPAYQEFMLRGGADKSSRIVYGPDGNPIVYDGPSEGAPKPLREFEAKAVQFNERMRQSLPRVLDAEKAIESKGGVSIWDQATSSETGKRFGGNFLTSEEFQTYQAAAREWIAGLLRLDSGAAVPETEFVRYFSTFFYEAGDNEKTRANKRAAREATMQALQQIVPPDRQVKPEPAPQQFDFSTVSDEDLMRALEAAQ